MCIRDRSWTQSAPIVGTPELIEDEIAQIRPRAVAFQLAKRLVNHHFALGETIVDGEVKAEPRPWLFPRLVDLCTTWIDRAVRVEEGWHLGHLAKYAQWQARACDAVYAAITRAEGNRRPSLRPILRRHDPHGSTGSVRFSTRKAVLPTSADRSEISHVVLDGVGGNTWEQLLMQECEHHPQVAAYAKNDHLSFSIPYIHEGTSHAVSYTHLDVYKRQALHSLYRSYEKAYEHWHQALAPLDEPPPVFIVVCPNTAVSKLVHDWIAGTDITRDDGSSIHSPGHLPLFVNTDPESATTHPKPRTILVDSAQLESGETMKDDFKQAAAAEIAAFKQEYRLRNPGADADALTDEDLLREVMNTVGKRGMLGADVRCVVSVAMLTEGWDANTVTHILGIRAFKSQLLCEQVVGRGLRRRSYAVNDEGRFEACLLYTSRCV